MSKYTTEVRFICENAAGYDESKGFNSVEDIITIAAPKVFNFDFPIFDENYRLPLEKKILRHYYTREIGEETVGLWKLRMQDTLCNLMPYYNKLYESELIKFNPLYDVDMTTTHKGSNDTVNELNRDERHTGTVGTGRIESTDKSREYNVNDNGSVNIEKESNEDRVNSNDVNENKRGNNSGSSTGSVIRDMDEVRNESVEASGNVGVSRSSVDTEKRDNKEREDRVGTANEKNKGTNTDTTNGSVNNDEWNLYSDTPQGGLTGVIRANETTGDVAENAYLTNARHTFGTQNTVNNITESENDNERDLITGDIIDRNGSVDIDKVSSVEGETISANNTARNVSAKNQDNSVTYNENENKEDVVVNRKEDGISSVNGNENVKQVNDNRKTGTDSESINGVVEETVNNNALRNTSENGIISNMDEYEEHIIGKRSYMTYSKMLQEFRETFLNIDMMILEELKPCFLNLW